jgi:hypothetical protein
MGLLDDPTVNSVVLAGVVLMFLGLLAISFFKLTGARRRMIAARRRLLVIDTEMLAGRPVRMTAQQLHDLREDAFPRGKGLFFPPFLPG